MVGRIKDKSPANVAGVTGRYRLCDERGMAEMALEGVGGQFGGVRCVEGNGLDMTERFPECRALDVSVGLTSTAHMLVTSLAH